MEDSITTTTRTMWNLSSGSIGAATVAVPTAHLERVSDMVLIMEMIRRGYAVALLPAAELAEGLTK